VPRGLVGRPDGDQHGAVAFDVDQLLRLWTDALPGDDAGAAAAFRELYTDPVSVNGVPLAAADLVTRARVMQAALEQPERQVLSVVDAGDSVAVAFRLAGRQVGPLDTPAGRLPPTGQRVAVRIIDVLTLTDGRISAIWMVADWLTTLAAVGAVELRTATDRAGAASR
jgi:predicted ester cyclase